MSAGVQMGRAASRIWFSVAESGWVPRQLLQRSCNNGSRHFFFYECGLHSNPDGARLFRLNFFGD
jgi:hypothetical protein